MTQRMVAALAAVPLVLGLLVAAAFAPLPYATYRPGLTVDVLAKSEGHEIIQVRGHEAYRTDGELRMTTVFVSLPGAHKSLVELMGDWLDEDSAVYPYDAVYPDDESEEENRIEGQIDMVTSQDKAVAVALRELGKKIEPDVSVAHVFEGAPAEGKLEVRDQFVEVNGREVDTPQELVDAVESTPPGEPTEMVVLREGRERTVRVLPRQEDGGPKIGVAPGTTYRFPFRVSVNIDPDIGGPSAGLMFALAVYDTLTPGSLTGGHAVAGTGTIDEEGKVGPIGGIQQKIAGARDDGAELFLVPPDNCDEALGAEADDVRLVRAETMHEARLAIEAWVADEDAELPSCEAVE